jgi:MerR family transcriptional regulator, copper efflux regulator
MGSMTIGKVAKGADVAVGTVRFYEREGLIQKPPRRNSGYRAYPADTVDRLRFIKRAKELGFSLKEIKELMAFASLPARPAGRLKSALRPRSNISRKRSAACNA